MILCNLVNKGIYHCVYHGLLHGIYHCIYLYITAYTMVYTVVYISCNIPWPPCPTALGTGLELLQIPAWGEAMEAGSMSSTFGCGAMGGGSLAGSLWKKLSRGIERD
jgi:hypothetical protein